MTTPDPIRPIPVVRSPLSPANENVVVSTEERDAIRQEVTLHFQRLLRALRIDTDHDHNTKGTAERVARMFVDEVFRGRFHPAPEVTSFPNVKRYDGLYTVGPMTIRSCCSHHFAPILGTLHVAVIPGGKVIGLSKFSRLADWILTRPQIQEEATEQLADAFMDAMQAKAVAVRLQAKHLCMLWRGVREHESEMTTYAARGLDEIEVRRALHHLEALP